MATNPESEHLHQLKTAAGIADPVLIRLSTPIQHVLLLAEDASYDRAGLIRMYNVQCALRKRGVRGLLSPSRATAIHPHINVRTNEQHALAGVPGMATVRVPSAGPTFSLTTLSRVEYEALSTATSRRLLQASRRLRRPALHRLAASAAGRTMNRLRFAIARAIAPAAFR